MFNFFEYPLETSILLIVLIILFLLLLVAQTQLQRLTPTSKFIAKHLYVLEGGMISLSVQNRVNFEDAKDVKINVTAEIRVKNTHDFIRGLATQEQLEEMYGMFPFHFGIVALQNVFAEEKVLEAYDAGKKTFEKKLMKKMDEQIFFSGYKVTSVQFQFIDNDRKILEDKVLQC